MELSITLGIFSILLCFLFCIVRSSKAGVPSLVLKSLASICFLLSGFCAIYTVGLSNVSALILVGLIFGLLGDILLDLKVMYPEQNNQYFIYGTTAFAIGHAFYFVACTLYANANTPNIILWSVLVSVAVSALLTTVILLVSKKMNMNFGKMIYVVCAYSAVLTFMLSYTIAIAIFNPIFWIFAVGIGLFFFSDLVLSMQYFGGKTQKVLIYVNHILYYLAQMLIAISIIWICL